MLSYTSQPYSEAMAMRQAVTYFPYAKSSKEQTGDVITFAQFEEGNILTETSNDAESCDESDNKSIMMSEQDMENIKGKHVIKYVIVLGTGNWNGKEILKLRKALEKVNTRYLVRL